MANEVSKVKKISDSMQEIDELAKSLSKKSEDKLLVCAALLAVTTDLPALIAWMISDFAGSIPPITSTTI